MQRSTKKIKIPQNTFNITTTSAMQSRRASEQLRPSLKFRQKYETQQYSDKL